MKLNFSKRSYKRKRKIEFRFHFFLMLTIWVIFGSAKPAAAAPGDLDPTFGSGGIAITGVQNFFDPCSSMTLQSDGKIIAIGESFNGSNFDFGVVRFTPDGKLDSSFGMDGKVVTNVGFDDIPRSVTIQTDEKIVIAGYTLVSSDDVRLTIVRYKANGTLDNSFDGDGIVIAQVGNVAYLESIKIQPDGKIIVAGYTYNNAVPGNNLDIVVARFNSNGSHDTTFGVNGIVLTDINSGSDYAKSVDIQSDGKFLIGGTTAGGAGYQALVIRYNQDGSLDTTFGLNGIVKTSLQNRSDAEFSEIVIQPDGKIIGVGSVGFAPDRDSLIIRYNQNGALDLAFDQDGIVILEIPYGESQITSAAIQKN